MTDPPYEDDMVAKWDFNINPVASVPELKNNNCTLTNHGCESTATGFHSCYKYSVVRASGDYLEGNTNFSLPNPCTIEIVLEADNTLAWKHQYIFFRNPVETEDDGWRLTSLTFASGEMNFVLSGDTDGSNILAHSTWKDNWTSSHPYHLFVDYYSGGSTPHGRWYWGDATTDETSTPDYTTNTVWAVHDGAANVRVGISDTDKDLNGAVYLIRVHNTVLSAAQRQQNLLAERWRYSSADPPGGPVVILAVPIQSTASVPSPTVKAGVTITAVPVVSTASVPSPTLKARAKLVAVPVQSVASVPSPTLTAGARLVAVPIQSTASVPSPTVKAGATLTAVPVESTGIVPEPTIIAGGVGGVIITAVPIESTGFVPGPTIKAGATVTAVPIESTASVPEPTIRTPAVISAVTALSTASVPSPTVKAGATLTAVVIESTGLVPEPTIIAGAGVVITAVPIQSTASVPSPTLKAGARLIAVVIESTASVPEPTIRTPAVISAVTALSTASVPSPTIRAASRVIVVPIESTGLVPGPTLRAGVTLIAVVIESTGLVPSPTIIAHVFRSTTPLNATTRADPALTGSLSAPAALEGRYGGT